MSIGLVGGVSNAWATVTATLSGMNKVGDYYYPIYTLSESSTIASFTSSNGVAPAAITDGTTLTFSHRGTVTLASGETFTGKKYAANEVGFKTLPSGGSKANSGKEGTMNGFSDKVYRWQYTLTSDFFTGFTLSGWSNSKSAYIYYAFSTSDYSGSPLGMNVLNDNGNADLSFTVSDDNIAAAILTYYHNSDAAIAVASATLEKSVINREAGDEMKFNIHDRSNKYYYQTLTTYTIVAETLSDVTATFSGLAETSGYYYPVYTITATHDEDGEINPTLGTGAGYDVAANVLTYTARTASTTDVNISYGGANSVAEVPASVKYKQYLTDFTLQSTFSSLTEKKGNPTIMSGFSDTGIYRYDVENNVVNDFVTLGSLTNNKWILNVDKGINFYHSSNSTNSTIAATNLSSDSYAILYYKLGTGTTYEGTPTKSEMKAGTNGDVSFTAYNKDGSNHGLYLKMEIYKPVSTTIIGGYSLDEEGDFKKNAVGNYYYREYTYTISSTKYDEGYDDFTVSVVDGDATVDGKTVKNTGSDGATIRLTDTSTSDTYDIELPATTSYLLTNDYDFGDLDIVPTELKVANGETSPSGFTSITKNRYTIRNSSSNDEDKKNSHTFNGITTGTSMYGWQIADTYGISFSTGNTSSGNSQAKTSTIVFNNAIDGQIGVLSYKVSVYGSSLVWAETQPEKDIQTVADGKVSFTAKDKDGNYDSKILGQAMNCYTYTRLQIYTPVSVASQEVNVNEAVGGMGTLVANYPMDFSDDDLKAYTAEIEGSTVTFTRIKKVPAYTPVLVKYKSAETAAPSIPFCNAEDVETVSTNALKAGTGATVDTYPDETHTNFVLTTGNSGASHGFYFANGRTVATNRAYLQADTKIAAAGARLNVMFSDEETTDINAVNREQLTSNGAVYNLQGQRVSNPTKGLFIVNGKKMIVK